MGYAVKLYKNGKWYYFGTYNDIQKYGLKSQAKEVADEFKKYSAKVVPYPNVITRGKI